MVPGETKVSIRGVVTSPKEQPEYNVLSYHWGSAERTGYNPLKIADVSLRTQIDRQTSRKYGWESMRWQIQQLYCQNVPSLSSLQDQLSRKENRIARLRNYCSSGNMTVKGRVPEGDTPTLNSGDEMEEMAGEMRYGGYSREESERLDEFSGTRTGGYVHNPGIRGLLTIQTGVIDTETTVELPAKMFIMPR